MLRFVVYDTDSFRGQRYQAVRVVFGLPDLAGLRTTFLTDQRHSWLAVGIELNIGAQWLDEFVRSKAGQSHETPEVAEMWVGVEPFHQLG